MSESKSQHYVPQCYLREWIDPNIPVGYKPYVWIFDKNGKNRRRKAPKNILKSTDLYTLNIKGKAKDYSIEETLAKIESEYASIFQKKIKKRLPLSEYEHVILCAFVATMLQRTLRHKGNFERFFDEMTLHVEALSKQYGAKSKEVEKWKKYKGNAHKMGIVQALPDLTRLILKMDVAFLCVDDSGSNFITSDDPCSLFNPKLQWQKLYGPGLGQRHVQVTLPLSPDIMLCLSWSKLRGYIKIKKGNIEDLNRLVRGHCFKYFISHTPKTKQLWFRSYPLDLFFIIKLLKHKTKARIHELILNRRYRNVKRR